MTVFSLHYVIKKVSKRYVTDLKVVFVPTSNQSEHSPKLIKC